MNSGELTVELNVEKDSDGMVREKQGANVMPMENHSTRMQGAFQFEQEFLRTRNLDPLIANVGDMQQDEQLLQRGICPKSQSDRQLRSKSKHSHNSRFWLMINLLFWNIRGIFKPPNFCRLFKVICLHNIQI